MLDLGSNPYEEDTPQLGSTNYEFRARATCIAYKQMLKRKFPDIKVRTHGNQHDFGVYYTVVAEWDKENDEQHKAALAAEGIAHWDQPARENLETLLAEADDIAEIRQREMEHAESLSMEELENMMFDGVVETADGCLVEPDGKCPHGYRSPLIVLGYI